MLVLLPGAKTAPRKPRISAQEMGSSGHLSAFFRLLLDGEVKGDRVSLGVPFGGGNGFVFFSMILGLLKGEEKGGNHSGRSAIVEGSNQTGVEAGTLGLLPGSQESLKTTQR